MNMARNLASSWGRQMGSVIALAFATLVLVACGGGGGSAPEPTVGISTPTTGVSQAQSCGATVTNVTVDNFSGANATGVSVNPKFTGSVTVTGAGCGDAAPKVAVRLDVQNCPGSQSLDAVVTMTSASAGTFVATPSTLGNALTCEFTVNPAVNGKAGTTLTGSFTTEAVTAKPVFDYKLGIAGAWGTPFVLVEDTISVGGVKGTEIVSKVYTRLANCEVGTVADTSTVWLASDGYPRIWCSTPLAGNAYRAFTPKNGELVEDTGLASVPAGVTPHGTAWWTSAGKQAGSVSVGNQAISVTEVGNRFVNGAGTDLGFDGARALFHFKSN